MVIEEWAADAALEFHTGRVSLENPVDGGAWWAAVHGVARSRTWLHFHFHFHFSLSCTGEGNGNPLQCSCLENPGDRGAWWAAVYAVAQRRTRLKYLSSSSSILEYWLQIKLINIYWTSTVLRKKGLPEVLNWISIFYPIFLLVTDNTAVSFLCMKLK